MSKIYLDERKEHFRALTTWKPLESLGWIEHQGVKTKIEGEAPSESHTPKTKKHDIDPSLAPKSK